MDIGCIYRILNLITGKVYIGQTKQFLKRRKRHFSEGKNGKTPLYKSIRKYGKEMFLVNIEEFDIPIEIINQREAFWIKYYKSDNREYGYNLESYTENGLKQHSEETKNVMSKLKLIHGKYSKNFKKEKKLQKDINESIKKGLQQYYSYEKNKEKLLNVRLNSLPKREIIQKELNTGKIINIYPTYSNAYKNTGINAESIRNCCTGIRQRKIAGGYNWECINL